MRGASLVRQRSAGPQEDRGALHLCSGPALWGPNEGSGGHCVLLSGHPRPCRSGGTRSPAAHLHTHTARWSPKAHLPVVVQALGLDVVPLLVHRLCLGVQLPAQVLEEQGEWRHRKWGTGVSCLSN